MRILEAARNTPLLVSTFSLDGSLLAQNPAATACYRHEIQPGKTGELTLSDRFADLRSAHECRLGMDRH